MKSLTLLICLALLVTGTPNVSAFVLFPGDPTGQVLDNGPLDADARWGFITLRGPVILTNWGGVSFMGSGAAGQDAVGGGINHWIQINGEFSNPIGAGAKLVVNQRGAEDGYNFPFGDGRNISWFTGTCETIVPPAGVRPNLSGMAWLEQASFGTTFNNNAPVADWMSKGGAPTEAMSGYDLHGGTYQAGPGLHYLEISFMLGGGEKFVLPGGSLDGRLDVAPVPEPATLMLLSLGSLALLRKHEK